MKAYLPCGSFTHLKKLQIEILKQKRGQNRRES